MSLPDLSGRNICILATHGFEESELLQPRDDLKGAGANVTIVSPESGEIKGWKGDDWGQSVSVDAPLSGARVEQYDELVLQIGRASCRERV